LTIVRDFLDLRDVVKAYHKLILNGKSGEIYNVCSGIGHSFRSFLDEIKNVIKYDFRIEIIKDMLRPMDNPIIIGSNEKIKTELGWKPEYSFRATLNDMIDNKSNESSI